jgi:hypothetical protein
MGIAFALAGLGGFNAHGAGFLAAATKCGVMPELVTATSGQIVVLSNWLAGKDLEAGLITDGGKADPLAQLRALMFGDPGVFRPAYVEALARFTTWPDFSGGLLNLVADRLLPAQQYVPERRDADFEQITATLNGSAIGVVFNTYDPRTGQGFLFGNDAARGLLPTEKAITNTRAETVMAEPGQHDLRYVSQAVVERDIHPITVDAVKSALWLSLYGFHNRPGGQMDGAYHRSCIVSELHVFDHVFVARPLAQGWRGKEPANWFEVQDWQTEMWFSVAYKAEVDALKRINDLIEAGKITDAKFKKVELVEIEPETPAGYFHYFVERPEVYDAAFKAAVQAFEKHLGKPG